MHEKSRKIEQFVYIKLLKYYTIFRYYKTHNQMFGLQTVNTYQMLCFELFVNNKYAGFTLKIFKIILNQISYCHGFYHDFYSI